MVVAVKDPVAVLGRCGQVSGQGGRGCGGWLRGRIGAGASSGRGDGLQGSRGAGWGWGGRLASLALAGGQGNEQEKANDET